MNKIPIYILLIIILSMITVAAPPDFLAQESTSTTQLIILYPKHNLYAQYQGLELHYHILNSSGALLTNVTYCTFHLYNTTNNHVLKQNLTLDGADYSINLAAYTDIKGIFSYNLWCADSNSGQYGYLSDSYIIGNLQNTTQNDFSILAIALIILGLPFLLIYISSKLNIKEDSNSVIPLNTMISAVLWAAAFLSMVVLLIILYSIALTNSLNDAILGPIQSLFTYGLWTMIILMFLITFGISFNLLYKVYLNVGSYFSRRGNK